ncbi:hypothetical protein M4I21_00610 [Cellulophaga sp. 20_2_10]|uniref:hypothetical protein n=1 Tax=Cellulophaga sp. 20_2_10 TaxID=2942476 RepID=UPI00201A757D|nr:hypothetical protein [Cellulophaga sp. 20_2_10]MCL5244290.1 hypothetical protein [Cellulophaga sp. 20_2_10]
MKIIIIKVLFFCLIPLGSVALYFSIKLLRKKFRGDLITEFSFLRNETNFIVDQPGNYAVWYKAVAFKKNILYTKKPRVINLKTKEPLKIRISLFGPRVNNFDTGVKEMYHFYAEKGEYTISLEDALKFKRALYNAIPNLDKGISDSRAIVQVNKKHSGFFMIFSILAIVFSVLLIIGGFLIGLLADQIFI